MLFNSIEFVFFFALVLVAYHLLAKVWTARKAMLLLASYVFYMAWNPPFALLLAGSTLLDFFAGQRISATDRKRVKVSWLVASCVGNLGVLAFFKYGDFILSNVWGFAPPTAVYPQFFSDLVLPMGISFYTFQSMSYTIDVYRDRRLAESSFLNFALYVSFFPQLVAGPIVRATQFLPQLQENRRPASSDVLQGMDQVMRGFAKKVIIADGLAVYVDMVYANPNEFGAVNQLIAVYAYAFQIYCDFSGYSDIAIGVARMLGFKLPENFRLPYISQGPSDFWTRWHISLSTWLRDYLYISLGGSKTSRLKTYRNLFITMLLGGLWHGAAWNFVIWGAFHGTWLVIHRLMFRDRSLFRVPRLFSIFCTFHLACLGWVAFRAESLNDIGTILTQFFDFSTPVYQVPVEVILILVIAFGSHALGASGRLAEFWGRLFYGPKAIWYAVVIALIFVRSTAAEKFIYFQF